MSEEKKGQLKNYIKFSGIAIQMLITIYLGNLLGNYIDTKYGYDDFYSKIITLIAVFLSMYLVIKQVIKISSED